MAHKPVLLEEAIALLNPKAGDNYIDATIGGGGHARKILEQIGPSGKLLGIDWDASQIRHLKEEWKENSNITLIAANYKNLENIIEQHNFPPPDGIIFDLGFGLHTLEDSGKGFSFRKDEPLIMRYGEDGGPSAADMLNTKSAVDLEKIFNEYGEERFSKQIAERIVEERRRAPIKRTTDLVRIIREVVPERYKKGALDPATRTFQALRIAVNDEFGNIRNGLEAALRVLADNGRIAVIAFHSGEDRIAKEVFKQAAKNGALEIITKHVIKPHRSEILLNRASRSAKLRVGIKHIV